MTIFTTRRRKSKMPPTPYIKKLQVSDYDELRDTLPSSGIFDMMDCTIEIQCPELAEAAEIERMTRLIESMVNVTDVRVSSTPEDMANIFYTVTVTEVPNPTHKRFIK